MYVQHQAHKTEFRAINDSGVNVEGHFALTHWIESFQKLTEQWVSILVDVLERHRAIEKLESENHLTIDNLVEEVLKARSIRETGRPFLPLVWKISD